MKYIVIAIIVLQMIAGWVAQKKAAEKKRREAEEAARRAGRADGSLPDEADQEEAGPGDLFDIFNDKGAVRPEPPPPLGSRGGVRQASPRTPDRLPAEFVGHRAPPPPMRATPTPPRAPQSAPLPAPQPASQRASSFSSPVGGTGERTGQRARNKRSGKSYQMSERERENARRKAERAASKKARQGSHRVSERGSVSDRKAYVTVRHDHVGSRGAVHAAPKAAAAAVNPTTAADIRKAFLDPRQVRSAFIVSEILRPPAAS
ncbi:MAG: hypothetical protein JNL80_05455 [Phycisphaerae bacterium]|jgi:hypothetical protein|nr:hypothetical protein [Phycisphaerae bacterium]